MDLYPEIARLVASDQPLVVATVIDTAGSTPQKPGTKMVVLAQSTLGTVGGGAIEHQIIAAARELLCGPGSTRLIETHLTHELGMCCGGKMKVFLEKHSPQDRLWVFGAGHVGTELARLADQVGFMVTVVDERPEWASKDRFPKGVALELSCPAQLARGLAGGVGHYFCIATHHHPLDQAVLEALVNLEAAYLGVIGSVRKAERFKLRLRAAGFAEERLERIHSPMGLPIMALTPAEIAVSIVAQLVQVRRKDQPRR